MTDASFPSEATNNRNAGDWQPLPRRARALCVLGGLPVAIPAIVAGFVVSLALDRPWTWSMDTPVQPASRRRRI